MKTLQKTTIALMAIAGLFSAQIALAKTVKVTMTAMETEVTIDNKGTKYPAWTFDGAIPGKFVRVTEGDTVDFTLTNLATNKNSHAMDFHAAQLDALNELMPIKPGTSKHFKFVAKVPGIFMYNCNSSPMVQHIARGMYGAILVEPKGGYSKAYPKPDREYVLVQGQYFPDAENYNAMLANVGWSGSLVNGKILHYDTVHDQNAKNVLEAKPGERVRIYFVNANINMPVALHPIAGIWDRVYISGNPEDSLHRVQAFEVAAGSADTFDIVSPKDHATTNEIVDNTQGAQLRGAITILMNETDADPKAGKVGSEIVP